MDNLKMCYNLDSDLTVESLELDHAFFFLNNIKEIYKSVYFCGH